MDRDESGNAEPRRSDGTDADEPTDREIPEAVLDLDHVFEALAHPRRRYLLYTLGESPEWTLEDLAAKVAAFERDESVMDVPETVQESVYVSLYHAHVPKLVEDGIVTFDEESETITAAEHAEQVLAVLAGAGASLDAAQATHAKEEQKDD